MYSSLSSPYSFPDEPYLVLHMYENKFLFILWRTFCNLFLMRMIEFLIFFNILILLLVKLYLII